MPLALVGSRLGAGLYRPQEHSLFGSFLAFHGTPGGGEGGGSPEMFLRLRRDCASKHGA